MSYEVVAKITLNVKIILLDMILIPTTIIMNVNQIVIENISDRHLHVIFSSRSSFRHHLCDLQNTGVCPRVAKKSSSTCGLVAMTSA